MQKLLIFQSLWAMERRHTDGHERSLDENVAAISEGGFDGVSAHYTNRHDVVRLNKAIRGSVLKIEGVCFPRSVDDLRLPLELAAEFPVSHINLQPDIRLRRIEDCLPLLDGWMRLAEDAGIPVFIETHRDRMTTDLFFTLDLLDHRPDLPLLADLSHFLVGREFAVPVDAENRAMIQRILRNAEAFHGRVASREQVQIEISFPHHRPWVDLFLDWWSYGFRNWRSRAPDDAELVFTCELGPKPYAITGRAATTRPIDGRRRCCSGRWRATYGPPLPSRTRPAAVAIRSTIAFEGIGNVNVIRTRMGESVIIGVAGAGQEIRRGRSSL